MYEHDLSSWENGIPLNKFVILAGMKFNSLKEIKIAKKYIQVTQILHEISGKYDLKAFCKGYSKTHLDQICSKMRTE